jgi:hypothetical protein
MKHIFAVLAILSTFAVAVDDSTRPPNGVQSIQVSGTLANQLLPSVYLTPPASSAHGFRFFNGLTGKEHITKVGFGLIFDSLNDAISVDVESLNLQSSDIDGLDTWRSSVDSSLASMFNGAYSSLTGKPTTVGGYGITDYNSLGDARWVQLAGSYANPNWITSLSYSKLTGVPTAVSSFTNDSGYITSSALSSYATTASLTSGLATKFNSPAGSTSQYLRGDGTLATFPSIPSAQVNSDWNSASGLSQIFNKPTLGTAAAQNSTAFDASGAAAAAQAASQPLDGDLTSLAAASSTSIYYRPAANTWSPVTIGAGITFTSGTLSATASIARSFSAVSRTLNTAFQISTTRDAFATYCVDIAASISLTAGQTGTVFLDYADDIGFTTNLITIGRTSNGNTGSLTVGLNLTQTATASVSGLIPAGKFVRIRTVNTTGSPTFTAREGQEVLF